MFIYITYCVCIYLYISYTYVCIYIKNMQENTLELIPMRAILTKKIRTNETEIKSSCICQMDENSCAVFSLSRVFGDEKTWLIF